VAPVGFGVAGVCAQLRAGRLWPLHADDRVGVSGALRDDSVKVNAHVPASEVGEQPELEDAGIYVAIATVHGRHLNFRLSHDDRGIGVVSGGRSREAIQRTGPFLEPRIGDERKLTDDRRDGLDAHADNRNGAQRNVLRLRLTVDVVGENRVEVDRGRLHDKVGASRHLRNLRLEAVNDGGAGRNHSLSRDLRQQADGFGKSGIVGQ
jgi:hypothetical protein